MWPGLPTTGDCWGARPWFGTMAIPLMMVMNMSTIRNRNEPLQFAVASLRGPRASFALLAP